MDSDFCGDYLPLDEGSDSENRYWALADEFEDMLDTILRTQSVASDDFELDDVLDLLDHLIVTKDFDNAIKVSELLANKNKTAVPFVYMGLAYCKMENYSKSFECYDKAEKADPSDILTFLNRCGLYKQLGNYDSALLCCDKAIALEPDNEDGYLAKAELLFQQNEFRKASLLLEAAVSRIEPSYEVLHLLYKIYIELNEIEEFLCLFDKLIDLYPFSIVVRLNKIQLHIAMKQPYKAIDLVETVLAINPNAVGTIHKADAYFLLGRYSDALDSYFDCLNAEYTVDDFKVYARIAHTYLVMSEYNNALLYFKKFDREFLIENSKRYSVRYNFIALYLEYAMCLVQLKNYKAAKIEISKYFKLLKKHNPDLKDYLWAQGMEAMCNFKLGKLKKPLEFSSLLSKKLLTPPILIPILFYYFQSQSYRKMMDYLNPKLDYQKFEAESLYLKGIVQKLLEKKTYQRTLQAAYRLKPELKATTAKINPDYSNLFEILFGV